MAGGYLVGVGLVVRGVTAERGIREAEVGAEVEEGGVKLEEFGGVELIEGLGIPGVKHGVWYNISPPTGKPSSFSSSSSSSKTISVSSILVEDGISNSLATESEGCCFTISDDTEEVAEEEEAVPEERPGNNGGGGGIGCSAAGRQFVKDLIGMVMRRGDSGGDGGGGGEGIRGGGGGGVEGEVGGGRSWVESS
ncbi:hypothetical protein K440DRAFT_644668 [Wilcoxina mikolae CBS 423.85]|nr:hypothetical protein K440DRAFT_644668 [Wilcoxina mikolae CBS 423.85]